MFNIEMCEDEKLKLYSKVNRRRAVRGIIFIDGKILLVQSKYGDYKFPGGGVKSFEGSEEALIREVEEETGYGISKVSNLLGEVIQISKDSFNEDEVFIMNSLYYSCSVTEKIKSQNLDKYEKDLDFKAKWVTLQEAIKQNKEIISRGINKEINWIKRETIVLEKLKTKEYGV